MTIFRNANQFIAEVDYLDETQQAIHVANEPPSLWWFCGNQATPLDLGIHSWNISGMKRCMEAHLADYTGVPHHRLASRIVDLEFTGQIPTILSTWLHPSSNLLTQVENIQLAVQYPQHEQIQVVIPQHLRGEYILGISAFWDGVPSGDALYTLPILIAG